MNIKILDKTKADPKLIYTEKSLATLMNMLESEHAQSKEFQFIGTVTKYPECDMFVIEDFYLVPNEKCSGVYCETDDEKYPEWLNENFPTAQSRKMIRCQCHSHVDMMTNPSGTDEKQILETVDQVKDYYIQLIVNKKLKNTCNLYDKERNMVFEDIKQYLLLQSAFISLENKSIENINEIVKIENNTIYVKDRFTVDFTKNYNMIINIDGDYIEFKNNEFIVKNKTDYNELFTKMIKKDYSFNSAYSYQKEKDYFEDDVYPYGYGYYGYKPYNYKQPQKKGKKKNESKQTSGVLQSTKTN